MATPKDQSPAAMLGRLAAHDERFIESQLGMRLDGIGLGGMDPKTCALVRIGALLAMGATAPAYEWAVRMARVAGATVEEIVGITIAMAPIVGVARLVSAAPALGLAINYDVSAALEQTGD
jgi:alkylhydroperoxidase/carboxymuconolactone decarboxylase family protein YurZ